LLGLYRTIGERLKHQFVGGEAWIISYKQECFEQIGLKPSFKIPLYNGSLDCEFRKYQIFDGKMQDFRAQGGEVKTDSERKRMAEKGRFKMHRGEFNGRFANAENTEAEEESYRLLKNRHREFEQRFGNREREGAEKKQRGERKDFERGGRKGFEKRDRREGEPRNGGRRERRDFDGAGKKPFGKKPFDRKPKKF
jgi:putative N6-adenine-specific DNA methylase